MTTTYSQMTKKKSIYLKNIYFIGYLHILKMCVIYSIFTVSIREKKHSHEKVEQMWQNNNRELSACRVHVCSLSSSFNVSVVLKYNMSREDTSHSDCDKSLRTGSGIRCNADILNSALMFFLHLSCAPIQSHQETAAPSARAYCVPIWG